MNRLKKGGEFDHWKRVAPRRLLVCCDHESARLGRRLLVELDVDGQVERVRREGWSFDGWWERKVSHFILINETKRVYF